MINHDRWYSAALVVLGALAALSTGLLFFLSGASAGGAVETHLPDWSLPWIAAVNLAYTIAITITLSARRFRPDIGRVMTRALNWALFPAVPGGTVVGLYGLLRVDKKNAKKGA